MLFIFMGLKSARAMGMVLNTEMAKIVCPFDCLQGIQVLVSFFVLILRVGNFPFDKIANIADA
jgi:hypothetical protein